MSGKKKWSGQRRLFSSDSLGGKTWPTEVGFQLIQLLAQLLIERVEEANPTADELGENKEEANDAREDHPADPATFGDSVYTPEQPGPSEE